MSRTVAGVLVAIGVLFVSAVGYLITQINWNRSVVIEGGPTIGFFYETGRQIDDWLKFNGVDSTLTQRDDTLRIIGDVNDPDNPVNVGFVAQSVSASAFPNVVSLGSIVQEPLLFFARSDLGADLSIEDLKGLRIQIGPRISGVHSLASAALTAYGITADDVILQRDPTSEGISKVLSGDSDVVATLFPPQTPVIGELARDPRLQIVTLPNVDALAGRIGYVQPTVIPTGSFSLSPSVPAQPVETIGIPVTVIANRSLPDSYAYLIAERLQQLFSGATSTSAAGEFPNFVDTQLPASQAARDFYDTGRPWQFRILPGQIAEVFYLLALIGSVTFVLMAIYKFLLPDVHGTWSKILSPRQTRALLTELERSQAEGRPLRPSQQRQLTRLINQRNRDKALQALLDDYVRNVSQATSDDHAEESAGRSGG